MEHVAPYACELLGKRRTLSPGERAAVEDERRGIDLLEGTFLFACESSRREQVEEAVLSVRTHRMMEPGRRLEDETSLAARANEAGERADTRHGSTAAPDLGAEPVRDEVVEPNLDTTVEWRLHVHLASGNGIACTRID